jgi:hypothetical protein
MRGDSVMERENRNKNDFERIEIRKLVRKEES